MSDIKIRETRKGTIGSLDRTVSLMHRIKSIGSVKIVSQIEDSCRNCTSVPANGYRYSRVMVPSVFCKYIIPKIADPNGENVISIWEKAAGRLPAKTSMTNILTYGMILVTWGC